jgi:8-oxo-dGTP pyrophosphatase MutT (NUDIX family)
MTGAAQRIWLYVGHQVVGSVLPADALLCPAGGAAGVRITADAVLLPAPTLADSHTGDTTCNAVLAQWAAALHATGRLKAWRNERLSVAALPAPDQVLTDCLPELAQLERGAARRLGILTHAVHLVGFASDAPDSAVWMQQRALNKATDPGLWDTLAGGLLSAGDGLHGGMLRETHEEAGLLPADLLGVRRCGMVQQSRYVPDGHILEAVWTYRAVLRAQAAPRNLDGEVMGFACLSRADIRALRAQGLVTQEACLALEMAGV